MTWTPFFRAVGLGRRPRRVGGSVEPVTGAHNEGRHRHPAMMGIDVPPVHGRHCICARCERQSRAAG